MPKLNLGCGEDYQEGWVNVDIIAECDVVANLEEPLPFKDEEFDEVLCSHVLEHIHNLVPLQRELARVMNPGAPLIVVVPYYLSPDAWGDPTHCRGFSVQSFLPCWWEGFVVDRIEMSEVVKLATRERCQHLRAFLRRKDK